MENIYKKSAKTQYLYKPYKLTIYYECKIIKLIINAIV